jgi:hypothetical protein
MDETNEHVRVQHLLHCLAELLEGLGHPRAEEVAHLAGQFSESPAKVWQAIDGNDWWAGAGSLAAETMADNPGLEEPLWQQEARRFRTLLIELGEILQARGEPNPGLGSWLMAFQHWNASEV